eukprot:TRINITY_DN9932_c0_g1_i1.p1 TRINITY_DN9932_c0_g1~~TRINITY_DN9932_c0_g1_i1.p1  ORF type:complete len:165 (-),score=13.91 TRINITY_DN9932_c0_g1_i1:81-575(-)
MLCGAADEDMDRAGIFDVGGQLLVALMQLEGDGCPMDFDYETVVVRLEIQSFANGTVSKVDFRKPMPSSGFEFVTGATQLLVTAYEYVYSFAPCGSLAWSIKIKDDNWRHVIGVDGTDIYLDGRYLDGKGVFRLSHEESQPAVSRLRGVSTANPRPCRPVAHGD